MAKIQGHSSVKFLWIFIKQMYIPPDIQCHQSISHFLPSLRVLIMSRKERRKSPDKDHQQKHRKEKLKWNTADWWDTSVCLGTPTAPLHSLCPSREQWLGVSQKTCLCTKIREWQLMLMLTCCHIVWISLWSIILPFPQNVVNQLMDIVLIQFYQSEFFLFISLSCPLVSSNTSGKPHIRISKFCSWEMNAT